VISSASLAFVVPFLACIALTPAVRSLSVRWGAVDLPGPLKIHSRLIPRLGGVAVVLSICAGVLVTHYRDLRANELLAALGTVWLTGLLDDLRHVSPYVRLAAQIVAATFLWLGGWRFAIAGLLPATGAISLLSLCALVIVMANSANFLDGSDGIAAGTFAIVGISYVAVAKSAAVGQLASSIAFGLASACIAFCFFNFPPASVFLGDSGSTVLGFCVAFLALHSTRSPHPAAPLALLPLVIAGLPLVDCALAVIRRVKSGASIMLGDRRHIYDLLLDRGWSPRRVALACYGITAALAMMAWLSLRNGFRCFVVASGLSLAGLAILAIRLGSLRSDQRGTRSERHLGLMATRKPGMWF
jgi:UDP-GlcNAc:undecaprenyl-phosphate/decaprenyl-phosphate GlcNAc-1-phosphate transferase